MKHIFEEYGDVILQVIGGAGILGILADLIRPDGMLHTLIVEILKNGC